MSRRLLGPVGGPILFLLVAALVFGGLGWVTVAALRVEDAQREAAAQAELSGNLRVALWKLDGRMLPTLGVEDSRPFYHYVSGDTVAAYGPASAPLLAADLPEWMQLHFQLDPETGWESPQAPTEASVEWFRLVWPDMSLRNATPARAAALDRLKARHPARATLDLFAAREKAAPAGSPPFGVAPLVVDAGSPRPSGEDVPPPQPKDLPPPPKPDSPGGLPPVVMPPSESGLGVLWIGDREVRIPPELIAAAEKQSADRRRELENRRPGATMPPGMPMGRMAIDPGNRAKAEKADDAPEPRPVTPPGPVGGTSQKRDGDAAPRGGDAVTRAGTVDKALEEARKAGSIPYLRGAQNPPPNNTGNAVGQLPNLPGGGGVGGPAGGGGGAGAPAAGIAAAPAAPSPPAGGATPSGGPGGAGGPTGPAPTPSPPGFAGGGFGGAPGGGVPGGAPGGFGGGAGGRPAMPGPPGPGGGPGGPPAGGTAAAATKPSPEAGDKMAKDLAKGTPAPAPAPPGRPGGFGAAMKAPADAGRGGASKPVGDAPADAKPEAKFKDGSDLRSEGGAEKKKGLEKDEKAAKEAEAAKKLEGFGWPFRNFGLADDADRARKDSARGMLADGMKAAPKEADNAPAKPDPAPKGGEPAMPPATPPAPAVTPATPAFVPPFPVNGPPIAVHLGSMRPVWVTAADGTETLVLVRAARLDGKTVYQGVVIDWPKLDEVLRDEVRGLFPDARLVPVKDPAGVPPERTMTALPVQLDPGPAPRPAPAGWTPLRIGLVTAWVAVVFAFLAVALSGWSLIDLAERRIRFVSAVTHELRTPLTSLRLYIDLLLSGMIQDEDKRKEYLSTLNAESDRLHRLIDNVLDFARLERRARGTDVQRVTVADLLEQVRQTWSDRCGTDGKELVVISTLPPDQEVCTDPALVGQIVGNLIDNARKYTRDAADPRIWLWAKPEGRKWVVLEVEDRGCGVPPRERKHIFRPFRRGEAADTRAGGAGLGLALARQWAEVLGGRLTYRPADGGTGSCFRLELPAR